MRLFACLVSMLVIPLAIKGQSADTLVSSAAEDSTRLQVTRLRINSPKSDFSPFVLNRQLLFVSGRDREVAVQYVDANNDSEITDLYSCVMKDSLSFKGVSGFSSEINTKYHEGPFCLNKQGTVIYYTANDPKTSLLKIYRSEQLNGKWSPPVLMPFCRLEYSYCHPALSPDGSYLVFATNIDQQKKMDLYVSRFANGDWREPVAMRPEINDSTNQVFPYISASNVLYFSSDKAGGSGGLDIYYVSLDSDSSKVRPLSSPLNSAADDFGVWIDSAGTSGYFSSNRAPRSKDDIYYFARRIPDFTEARTVKPKLSFCYSFFEESTLTSSDTVNLTYEWDFGDGKKGRGLKTRHCFPGPGEYTVALNIVDKVSGEVFISQTAYPLSIEWPDQLIISCAETAAAGQALQISSTKCYLKEYELSKVYWSFGDGRYTTGKVVSHIYRKPGSYTIEAGIQAKHLSSGRTEQFRVEKQITINPLNDEK